MDSYPAYAGKSGPQHTILTPPWKANQHPTSPRHPPQNVAHRQVDSWRSYKNDATNLQAQTSTTSGLSATAPSFEPSSYQVQPSNYTSYQPLMSVHAYARYPSYRVDKSYRVSDGSAERATLEAAGGTPMTKKQQKKLHKQLKNAGFQAQSLQAPTLDRHAEPVSGFARRYPVRSNRGQADQPILSIEPSDKHLALPARNTSATGRSVTESPKPPEVSVKYLMEAAKGPVRIKEARKLLVILDLNGTLLYRSRANFGSKVFMRPGVSHLLDYLFTNHVVMVYTSAMPSSASNMLNQFLHPKYRLQLAAMWARDKLDLNKEQFVNKVQVYKKLDKIWNDASIQKTAPAGMKWDQSNTVLVDDSKLKAKAQPHNLIQVSEYTREDDPANNKKTKNQISKMQQDILKQLEMKLEELKYQEDVSRLIRKWQNGEVEPPRLPGQEVVIEETIDQKQAKEKEYSKGAQTHTHLPTPESSGEDEESGVPVSDDEDDSGAPLSPVSSIGESVFRELLEGPSARK